MADDFILNPGTGGITARADQLLTGQYVPYGKVMDGTADSTNAWIIDASGRGKTLADLTAQVTEDTASAGGEVSVLVAGVRNDTAAAKTSTDGDFGNIALDSAGRVGITTLGGTVAVTGSVGVTGTVAVSAASLPLPTGASTSAKQPALGTAGSPSSDVITVQGASGVTALPTTQTPSSSGGCTPARVIAAASTNATSVKASAGQVYGWALFNQAAYDVFVKLYNKASAPTVGTDTPVMTLKVPAGGGVVEDIGSGIAFGTGIALAITKLIADSDTTVLVANDCIANLWYK